MQIATTRPKAIPAQTSEGATAETKLQQEVLKESALPSTSSDIQGDFGLSRYSSIAHQHPVLPLWSQTPEFIQKQRGSEDIKEHLINSIRNLELSNCETMLALDLALLTPCLKDDISNVLAQGNNNELLISEDIAFTSGLLASYANLVTFDPMLAQSLRDHLSNERELGSEKTEKLCKFFIKQSSDPKNTIHKALCREALGETNLTETYILAGYLSPLLAPSEASASVNLSELSKIIDGFFKNPSTKTNAFQSAKLTNIQKKLMKVMALSAVSSSKETSIGANKSSLWTKIVKLCSSLNPFKQSPSKDTSIAEEIAKVQIQSQPSHDMNKVDQAIIEIWKRWDLAIAEGQIEVISLGGTDGCWLNRYDDFTYSSKSKTAKISIAGVAYTVEIGKGKTHDYRTGMSLKKLSDGKQVSASMEKNWLNTIGKYQYQVLNSNKDVAFINFFQTDIYGNDANGGPFHKYVHKKTRETLNSLEEYIHKAAVSIREQQKTKRAESFVPGSIEF